MRELSKARAAVVVVICFAFATSSVSGASEPCITLSGTYEYSLYQGRPAPLYSATYDFEASIAGPAWIIKFEETGDSKGDDTMYTKTVASSDGTNIFVIQFPNQRADIKAFGDSYASVKDQLPIAKAIIYPGDYPPSQELHLQNIWRAFASSSVLKDSSGKAKPPFVTDMATFYDIDNYCDYYWTTNAQQPEGRQLILKTDSHLFPLMINRQKKYVRNAPPYDQGYTNGVGTWRQATNIARAFVPTDFEFTSFSPKLRGRTAADLVKSATYRCIVTNIAIAPMPSVPTPLPDGEVLVTDRRFDKSEEGRSGYLGSKDWSPRKIDPAELAASLGIKLKIGDSVPDFSFKTLDGKALRLSDLRGKYVLLDFWATTCAPCVAEIPDLEATFDAFGKDPRFVLISLSLDLSEREPRKFVAARGIPWTQSFLDRQLKASVQHDYGFNSIPQVLLVGPDGELIHKDLRGPQIKQAVALALPH
jgi:peroxiredoxin